MIKKSTSFLVGAIAMLVLALPVQAQNRPSKADMRAAMAKMKSSPGFSKELAARKAELRASKPNLFRHLTTQRAANKSVVQTAQKNLSANAVKMLQNDGKVVLKLNNNTNIIANVTYFPEIESASQRSISRFSVGAPTELDSLAVGNYTFYHAGAIQDGIYYGGYLDTSYYSSYGWWWFDIMKFDAETWEYLGYTEIDDESGSGFAMVCDESATAPDGTVYGVFWTDDAAGVELGIPDYANMTRTTIGELTNQYVALGVSSDGQIYGIATDANLYKIDKTTAAETLVGPTGVAVANENGSSYYQCGEIDQKDDTFYWLGKPVTDGICRLYTVDLNTGAATPVQTLGNYTFVGMVIDKPAAADNAPNSVENLNVNFANGSTSGTVSFKAPTTTFGGEALTGDLTYSINAGETVLASGTTTPGAEVSVEVTAPEGMQTISVVVSNAEGNSPVAKSTLWIGFDIPAAPSRVIFTLNGNTATVDWSPVSAGLHNGFIGDITYDVYRYAGEESTLVAEGLTKTTFSEEITPSGFALYKYGVRAKNGAVESAITLSDGQALGDAIEPPYTANLLSGEVYNLFTTIDANQDETESGNGVWSFSEGTRYRYHSTNDADDWLISPPIKLKAGQAYDVIVNAYAYSSTWPERFEVKVGKAAEANALTITAINPTDVTNSSPEDFEGSLQVEEDGNYYIGIHAISDANAFLLYVNSLTIAKGPEATAPREATQLTVTPNAEGLTSAEISFLAPSLNIGGDNLTENIKADIQRDGEQIATIDDIVPGSTVKYTDADEELTIGTHTYQVFVSNNSGTGLKSEKVSAFIGLDIPATIDEIAMKDNISSVAMSWDKVTTGYNGGVIIPEKVDYLVWSLKVEEGDLAFDQQLETLHDANSIEVPYNTSEGEQGYGYWAVQPKNEAGESDATVGALIVGKPFELPLEEHFSGNKLQIPGWFYDTDGSTYTYFIYEYPNVSLAFDTESSDGDGASLVMATEAADTWGWITPGKIKVTGVANPNFIFDVKSSSEVNKCLVTVETPEGVVDTAVADFVPTEDWQTVKVNLSKYANEEYVFVKVYGTFEEVGYFWLDNFNIIDFMEYNLTANKVSAPKTITAGNEGKVNFTVKNMGENTANSYQVKVSVGDEVIFDETVNEPLASLASRTFEANYKTTIFTETGDKAVKGEVIFNLDLDEVDNTIEDVITVNAPTAAGVENLTVEAKEDGYNVSWKAPDIVANEITDDIENIETWPTFSIGGITETNHEGAFGDWKVYDGDGEAVYSWDSESIDYENINKPCAWQVFDPQKAGFSQETYTAHSGSQFLMAQCAAVESGVATSDDWLISPELPGFAQTISFWASQASAISSYGPETFEVLASSTDTNIESFTKVGDAEISSEEWQQFSFDLPEGTKYFAIRHTSVDVFALFIDDIAFSVGGGSISGYNVYVDEQFYGNVEDTNIDLKDLAEGTYKVSVTIIYANGVESAPVSIDVTATAIEDILKSGKPVDIYSLDGVLIRQQTTTADGLKRGVYIVDGKQAIVR